MTVIDVYSRRGCHLCEILLEELIELTHGRADVVVHDVDTRADWIGEYGFDVPVVEYRGMRLCAHRLDAEAVLAALAVKA